MGCCRQRNERPWRPLKTVCDRNPEKKVVGVTSERSMRIEHNGQWTDVPKECLSGMSFGVDGLALEGDDTGLGIFLTGKSTDKGESLRRTIFRSRDDIQCSQIERYLNVDTQDHEMREHSRDLR